jgi:hypothetical protein
MGSFEYGNELSNITRGGKCIDQMRDYQLLKKHSVTWSYLFWGNLILIMLIAVPSNHVCVLIFK